MLANRYIWIYKDDFSAHLSEQELSKFKCKIALKGEVIYANKVKMIFLKEGLAQVKHHSECGEFVKGFLEPNTCLILDSHSSLVCMQDCKYLQISLKKVQDLFNNQDFTKSLFNALVRDVLSLHEMVRDSMFLSTSQRLIKFIEARTYQNDKGERITHLPCSITNIASLLGVSRQNLSSEFNAMIKSGYLIKLNNNEYLITQHKL